MYTLSTLSQYMAICQGLLLSPFFTATESRVQGIMFIMNVSTVVYALLAGLLPSFVWLWFWLKEDNLHPEPRTILAASFVAGAIGVVIAIVLEKWVQMAVMDNTLRYVAWAAVEELVKFGAVVLIAFHANIMDEPIDAMIYCITVALGFAALENAMFIISPLSAGELSQSIVTGNLRFIGASLVHVVSSASIGFFVGLSFYRGIVMKTLCIIGGIILAVALHSAFNLAIIYGTAITTLRVFGWVWCAAVVLIILFEEVKAVHPKVSSQK
jgi:RsiW-degrading membrane proteinase PrsW (M82 family)